VVVKKFSSSVQQVRPKENFGANFRTKATLESSISRLLLHPNLAKRAAPQDGVSGNRIQQTIAAERKSPACEDAAGVQDRSVGGTGNPAARKEQGRRRSIPQTALPAPDIEIGLRRPVDAMMPRFQSGRM
jgi:hypothetical protein